MKLVSLCLVLVGSLISLSGCSSGNPPNQNPPASPQATWEYTVLLNEHGELFPPHLNQLVQEGWEVHWVTGGQPYVAESQTTGGKTINTVKFSPRDFFLRRQKQQ